MSAKPTVQELIDYMSNVSLEEHQRRAANKVIDGLTRNLERRLNRRFGVEEVTETLTPGTDGVLWPSRRPVQSVTSVVGGEPSADVSWSIHGSRHHMLIGGYPSATIGTDSSTIYDSRPIPAAVTVTYRGGDVMSADDLADVKLAILEKAAQFMTNRHDDAKSVKGFETRDTTIQAIQMRWTDEEIGDLSRLRRIVVWT